jgi:hypothetical protein
LRKISLGLAALASLFLTCWPALQAEALPDAQGWNGTGWYVAGSAPLTPKAAATPAYVVFNGPHDSQSGCALVYDRLYAPIGMCRFLDIKPGT